MLEQSSEHVSLTLQSLSLGDIQLFGSLFELLFAACLHHLIHQLQYHHFLIP